MDPLMYKQWIEYREGPFDPRGGEIPLDWGKGPYESKPRSDFQGYITQSGTSTGEPESQLPEDRGQKDFLRRKVPEFNEPERWKGVKILGEGYGSVIL